MIYQIGRPASSLTNTTAPIRLVQCSDMHLFADPSAKLLGLNTQQSFKAVLELIQQEQPQIDLLLSTGDIAQQSTAATYTRFLKDMQQIDAPHFCIPGNHDLEQPYAQHLALNHLPCEVVIGNWCCILLDSSTDGEIAGSFSQATLDYLTAALKRQHDKHIIIALHHNPLAVGCDWLDQHLLKTCQAFFDTIAPFKQVKLVLHGHVHQQFEQMHANVMYMACPSTSLQFKPNSAQFMLDTASPGYRWLDLFADGSFSSEVSRLKQQHFIVDYQSSGY
ncbi:3',5'-cyclic-AMP phosphodiesterase [Alkanindiges sp. WGS2144]|uniref:3',5'-cyclic-AMP phosphodiesterase n=1 Tax=Alkanindiges sp. WGS2144 TaxID=3366808 RepID=UPI0037515278